eukprot:scaffold26581_cov60-Phaeocystis_antarctica.AAC.2
MITRGFNPDQLSPASGRDPDNPARSHGVEHNAPGHLRLNGHGAVDAERTITTRRCKLVGAGNQHDSAHRAIVECRNEVTRAVSVLRAGLQRWRGWRGWRGRQRGWRGRRGRRGRRQWRDWRGQRRWRPLSEADLEALVKPSRS